MSADSKFLSYREVIARVGAAAFKEDFVRRLTPRERWILEETGLFNATLKILYEPTRDPQGPFASHPELPAARARIAYLEWQHNQIYEWTKQHGIEPFAFRGHGFVFRAAFEAAFAHSFPEAVSRSSSAPEGGSVAGPTDRLGRPPKWDWFGAMAAYAAHLSKDADGLPEKQAEAERWVQDWFIQNSSDGNAPAITEIRIRVAAPIYKASRKVGKSKK